ncbi:MAG: DJ-1/PfpI family protein [Hyphomicrobiaceae bacterium]
MSKAPFRVGFLLFPRLTQLDMTGPYEVLTRMKGAEVHLLWKTREPVKADSGLAMLPTMTLAECPQLDLVCVPGGPGVIDLLDDEEVLGFLRRQAAGVRFVTSVCTGSLVLGAAGLLKGKRATCHWMSRPFLASFGAIPVEQRVVVDGNTVTGGGVTAGIDFALRIVAELEGQAAAEAIQLSIEYDPDPPFKAGSPAVAPAALVERTQAASAERQAARAARIEEVAARLR